MAEMDAFQKQELLSSLRAKFREAAARHGKALFNTEELESRIEFLLRNRGNVMAFLSQEKEFFDTLMKKAQEKEEDRKRKEELNRKVEEIMSANNALIEKYPDYFFDPQAGYEIRRFTGAVSGFADRFETMLLKNFGGTREGREMEGILSDLSRFIMKKDGPVPVLLRHYIDELKSGGEKVREDIERKLLQTGGTLLYRLDLKLQSIMGTLNERRLAEKADVRYVIDPPLREAWKNRTLKDLHFEAETVIRGILTDFRLNSLVEHGFRQQN